LTKPVRYSNVNLNSFEIRDFFMLVRFCQTSLILSIVLSALLSTSHAAKIYRWVDENGLPHYSEKPPREVQSETLNIRPTGTGTASSSSSSKPNSVKKEAKVESPEEKEEGLTAEHTPEDKAKYCQQSRDLLAQMNGNTNRRFEQSDGSYRKLEQTEIADYLSQANNGIASYCN
jgi:hypothetical protein